MEIQVESRTARHELPIMAILRQYPLLSREEERSLVQHCVSGDEVAREKLILSNLRLVVWNARRVLPVAGDAQFHDLISAGIVGLIKAVDKLDASFENKFASYAIWWIRQSIGRALEDCTRAMRVSHKDIVALRKYARAKQKLVQKLERHPEISEIAAELELSLANTRFLAELERGELSLDEPLSRDGYANPILFGDLISDESQGDANALLSAHLARAAVEKSLVVLKPRERAIIESRFGLNGRPVQQLEDIGKVMGISRGRVQQIEMTALKKLRVSNVFRNKAHLYL